MEETYSSMDVMMETLSAETVAHQLAQSKQDINALVVHSTSPTHATKFVVMVLILKKHTHAMMATQ